jgi:hypothetical protein
MITSQICRYCSEGFIAQPGKPGYVDECPACLHERTRPPIPKNFDELYLARFPQRRKVFKDLKKQFAVLGLSEEEFYHAMSAGLNTSGKQI